MKKALPFLFWLIFLPVSPQAAGSEAAGDFLDSSMIRLKDWHIAGQNTTRYNFYDENGYKDSSVFPHDSSQVYNETRLSLDRQFSPYETVNFSSAALINDSEYRSTTQGFVFEDIRSSWQKGDVAVPFRLDMGDYTSNFSYRTIQQNVKGMQLELQPDIQVGGLEQRHSVIGFFGMQQPDYRNFDFNRNAYSGASWLVDLAKYGVFGAHFVNNFRDKDIENGYYQDRNQETMGLSFEKIFRVAQQQIGIEAEVNQFVGDYDSFTVPNGSEDNKSDMGYFLNLTGASGELFDYGFRMEEYGDHFRPHGGVISPNRRSMAWKLGGRVYKDFRLDGRYEKYRDNLESTNRMDTNLGGLSFSGPIENAYLRDLNIYFDVFRENLDNGDRTVNVRTWSYVGHINSTIYKAWNGHLGFNFRNADDDAYRYVTIGREYTADIGHPLSFYGASGDARGGIVFRGNSGPTEGYQVGPFTSIALQKARHSLNFGAQYLLDDSRSEFGQDVSSFSFNGGYNYTYGPHRLGFDFEMYNRNPYEFLPMTEDYRLGFTYTFSFDKPVGTDPRDFSWREGYKAPASVLENISAESVSREITILEGVAPGKALVDVQAFLASEGFGKAVSQGDFLIYETRTFHNIDWRQRLVIEHKDGQVVRSVFLLDLDPSQNFSKSSQAYERVRGFMLKRYGNPAVEVREGEFEQGYASSISSGRLVRLTEWNSQAGKVRLGIPSRFNQPARIEIHHAQDFPAPAENRWGLDQI